MQPVPPPNLRPPSLWTKAPPAPSSNPPVAPEPPVSRPAPPEASPPLFPLGRADFPNRLLPEIRRTPVEEGNKPPSLLPDTGTNTEELLLDALRPPAASTADGGLRPTSVAPLWDAGLFLHQLAKLAAGGPERELVLSAARLIEKFRAWDELLQARRHNLYKA